MKKDEKISNSGGGALIVSLVGTRALESEKQEFWKKTICGKSGKQCIGAQTGSAFQSTLNLTVYRDTHAIFKKYFMQWTLGYLIKSI